jgi:hypothetical protein
MQPDFRQLCVEVSRLYYYGRHDGLAAKIQEINAALAATAPSPAQGRRHQAG